jgi:hypothetical protein
MKVRVSSCALVVLALGCGKSDSEKFADAYCAEFAKCCVQAGFSGDGKICRLLFSGGGSYDAKAGDACLAEMKAEVSAGTFCTSASSSSSSSCNSVYGSAGSGKKKPGDPCNLDSDCAASSEGKVVCANLYANGAFIDKCQVQIPGKVGDTPCVGTQDGDNLRSDNKPVVEPTDILASGYTCNVADGIQCSAGTCVALLALGGTCTSASDCVQSAFCDFLYQKCAPRVVAGAPCGTSSDTECVDGYYCDSTAKRCTAKLANSATCTTSNACQSGYCSSTCQTNPLTTAPLGLICGS